MYFFQSSIFPSCFLFFRDAQDLTPKCNEILVESLLQLQGHGVAEVLLSITNGSSRRPCVLLLEGQQGTTPVALAALLGKPKQSTTAQGNDRQLARRAPTQDSNQGLDAEACRELPVPSPLLRSRHNFNNKTPLYPAEASRHCSHLRPFILRFSTVESLGLEGKQDCLPC